MKDIEIVKLQWSPYSSQFSTDYIADTPFGHYCVFKDYDNGQVVVYYSDQGHIGEPCQSIKDAKQLAQSDFERRIKECFNT
ncbi:hypothetical protein E2605_07795 [Dysgonomonas capnocytophagoides]|uniref:Uncharacterized protein n=1 Tax=Dysgonomonas capnocytophagoides TaxID=45254 RepID=A0A4Y8L3H6_9BACT|nr:hypothetical protein [Dysgonomonas capnocytophagoides]TFD96714.1 hypothetical protein E2605_07795 [Dysgonomonas capnocytophagoides]